jgi:hypothetical protein
MVGPKLRPAALLVKDSSKSIRISSKSACLHHPTRCRKLDSALRV